MSFIRANEDFKELFDNSKENEKPITNNMMEETHKANVFCLNEKHLVRPKIPSSCKEIKSLQVNGFKEKVAAQDGSRRLFEVLSNRVTSRQEEDAVSSSTE